MRRNFVALLLSIVIIGCILRLYNLDTIPHSLDRDEAFLGYNAFSLIHTGRDMTGNLLPLHLESFLYTPAGYSYISTIPVLLFGLSAFSVRFASAFFGAITPIIFVLFLLELFQGSGKKYFNIYLASLLGGFFIVFSPWNILLSRTASVSTVVSFLIVLGLYLFLKARNGSKWILILSYLCFFSSLLFYIAPYSVLPFLIPLIFYFSRKNLKDSKIVHIAGFSLIMGLIIFTFLSPTLSLRARSLSITNYPEVQLKLDQLIREDGTRNSHVFLTRVFHNKAVAYPEEFLKNYFSHFSYDFLFNGQFYPNRYVFLGAQLFYFVDILFLLIGVIFIFRNRIKAGYFLLGWVVIMPLGSAMSSYDIPNMQRILAMSLPISGISAIGLSYVLTALKKGRVQKGIGVVLGAVYLYFLVSFLHSYYSHSSLYMPWLRNDGYRSLVAKISNYQDEYKKVVITNRESAPAIFVLFYEKYDPTLYQNEVRNSTLRDFDRVNFGKYEFSIEECPAKDVLINEKKSTTAKENVLYVNSSLCEPSGALQVLEVIKRSDGSDAFEIVKIKK